MIYNAIPFIQLTTNQPKPRNPAHQTPLLPINPPSSPPNIMQKTSGPTRRRILTRCITVAPPDAGSASSTWAGHREGGAEATAEGEVVLMGQWWVWGEGTGPRGVEVYGLSLLEGFVRCIRGC
jgi:hypothetical protein